MSPTNTCLVYLTDYIKGEMASGHYIGIIVVDVLQTFDCVNHDILCNKADIMVIDSS